MAKIKIEDIIEHLDTEISSALEAAVKEYLPGCEVNRHELFRIFKRAVGRKCSNWESVPDGYIEK